jgi:hypothetical protein
MAIVAPGEGKVFPDGADIPPMEALRRAARADFDQSVGDQ